MESDDIYDIFTRTVFFFITVRYTFLRRISVLETLILSSRILLRFAGQDLSYRNQFGRGGGADQKTAI